ncbi:MAG: outer membrane beta-barrel protein [Rubripirellula sp.]|nr:outer membrane beta-barrel protein [Rubripirellula sp.]
MKLSKLALIAAIACGTYAGNVFAQQSNDIQMVSCESNCDCGEPVCGCEPACDGDACDGGCDSGCDSAGCGLDIGLCDRISSLACRDCCIGDPWQLFGECNRITAGGWLQTAYQSDLQGFGLGSAGRSNFNSYPKHFQLQQGWLFAERAIDASCGFDIGGRVDFLYGTDAQDVQAFGNPGGTRYDNSWDNGTQYGSALPQLYLEVGYGDLSAKIGHVLTNIGYESVESTKNFFSSHSFAFNISQVSYTATGIVATYSGMDNVTLTGGWIEGVNTGFEDNGDAFIGGVALDLTDRLDVSYNVIGGRLSDQNLSATAANGYLHSIVAAYDVRCDLQYVMQTSLVDLNDNASSAVGVSNYLIKTVNDCLSVGARFEWLHQEDLARIADEDLYELTLGTNYRWCANLMFRPELRWDWSEDSLGVKDDGFSYATSAIMTF